MKLHGLTVQRLTSIPASMDVSAVICFAFNEDGHLLIIKNQRGWDVPGGHVEIGETPIEALDREVMEEACATISAPKIFMSATSTRSMVFYVATVKALLPFSAKHETTARKLVAPKEFLKIYGGGMPELVAHAITLAVDQSRLQ